MRRSFSQCSMDVGVASARRLAMLVSLAIVVSCRQREGADASGAAAAMAQSPAAFPSLSMAPDRFLDRGDVTIRYRVLGPSHGTPLLLLHGYTDRLEMWGALADSLAREHRVIVPDVRGFGRSEPRDTLAPFGEAMVDDQIALLDALGVRRVHLVGYSMGGTIAANMATRSPSRVASATFVAGAFFEDARETAVVLAPYIDSLHSDAGLIPFFRYILPTWPDSLIESAAEQYMADNDRHTLVRSLEGFPELALDWSAVRRSTVPAVVVVGTQDAIRPMSKRLAERWPGVRYLEAESADHADITTKPRTLEAVRLAIDVGRGR